MEPLPNPRPPHPPPPPPPPAPVMDSDLVAHLRSLLSAASSAVAALPSPLQPHPTTTAAIDRPSTPSPPESAATTSTGPPLPPPVTAINLALPPTAAAAAAGPYSDCPAVVRTSPTPIPASISIPAFLAAVCADFSSSNPATDLGPSHHPPRVRILPSELGLLRRELDSWAPPAPAPAGGGHHHHHHHLPLPGSYSYAVTRVLATFCLDVNVPPRWEGELRRWVIESSPRYGVKVDATDAGHILVLLRLLLKAMAVEARCLLDGKGMFQNGGNQGGQKLCFDPRAVRFECPRLDEGVLWLSTQLGVLYGERNGQLFTLSSVKEAVLQMAAACCCLEIVCLGGGDASAAADAARGGLGGEGEKVGGGEKGCSAAGDAVACGGGRVFLSQVAASIAALYERFCLEEKTKALHAQRPSKHQLLLEYSQALERGVLERSSRPNYRAILEYDRILSLSRRAEDKQSARAKTREELLAEERDYKRRRTSYRGKKVNRNRTEVLRDIIDEHMEEIKQAGGIGYLVEAAPTDIAWNDVLKSNNSHIGTYHGSYDFASSSSHDN